MKEDGMKHGWGQQSALGCDVSVGFMLTFDNVLDKGLVGEDL